MGIEEKLNKIKEKGKPDGLPIVATKINVESLIYADRTVSTARQAIELLSDYLYNEVREIGFAIYLDAGNMPLCVARAGIGDATGANISVRDIVQIGLLCNASRVIFVHNHPAMIPDKRHLKASKEDIHLTDTLAKACGLVGLMLIDSVIVAGYKEQFGMKVPAYYSMKTHNFYKLSKKVGALDVEGQIAKTEEEITWGEQGKEIWNSKLPHMTDTKLAEFEMLPTKVEI